MKEGVAFLKKKLAIYDEVAYSYRLMQRLNQELPSGYMVYSFSEEDSLRDFLSKENPDIVLVGELYYTDDIFLTDNYKLIILGESKENMEYEVEGFIYKYQPVSCIVKQLNAICGNTNVIIQKSSDVKYVGVYSPVRRCGKTTLAGTISKIYSRDKKVLCLNFEAFPNLSLPEINNDIWNMSDVFYFLQHKDEREILNNAIIEHEGIMYICPGDVLMDLQEISKDKWEQFFAMISDLKPADIVVIDFDENLSCYMQLLELCEMIFMPVLHDAASSDKIKSFESFLMKSGFAHVKGKIKKVDFHNVEISNKGDYEYMVEQLVER